jgi:hypothetical protein
MRLASFEEEISMGSSGSGKFHNYPPSGGKKAGSSGPQGKSPTRDRCAEELSDVQLEEVGRSTFFEAHDGVPKAGTAIVLRSATVGPRLSIDTADGESVGFLPTEYNYLAVCLKKGFSYAGEVTKSSKAPVPGIHINLIPSIP